MKQYQIEKILFFDTETTGLPEKGKAWNVDYKDWPYIVQIAWMFDGKEETHIIRPYGWSIPEAATAVHGITDEFAQEHGESFRDVMDAFLADAERADYICGHNIHFDTGMVKANILRDLGWHYFDTKNVEFALHRDRRIDTMRSTKKWVDVRNSWGKLKFPNLTELYGHCFPGESFPAHDALSDVKAVVRCFPVIVEAGLLEPKETPANPVSLFGKVAEAASDAAKIASGMAKEYGKTPETAGNAPILNANRKDDKLPVFEEKTQQNANLDKITSDLLSANLF